MLNLDSSYRIRNDRVIKKYNLELKFKTVKMNCAHCLEHIIQYKLRLGSPVL